MVDLRIPKADEAGLQKLAALDEDSMRGLVAALGKVSPILSRAELAPKIASEVDTIPRSDIDNIVEILLPLYLLQERHDRSVSEIAEDVCRAMDRSDNENLKFSGNKRQRFKGRLIELLGIEAVRVGAKALEMLFENQRSFLNARIVTEVRPIFGSNPEDTPAGALIVHMLKITYREQGEDREFFVALDTTDVGKLSSVLDRADAKAGSLKTYLERTPVSYIHPE